jgi:hypothetical protein
MSRCRFSLPSTLPQIVREITYRVLCGSQGGSLRALIAIYGRLRQIQRAPEHMRANHFQVIDVASLAEDTGMRVSAFHHNFKAVTATSPLQYLKTIRLHKARTRNCGQRSTKAGNGRETFGRSLGRRRRPAPNNRSPALNNPCETRPKVSNFAIGPPMTNDQ